MIDNWKKVALTPSDTIRKALKIIDTEALRAALVVNSDGLLLGTITDGDIRRGLIDGKGLDTPVDQIMNNSPVTATIDTDKSQLIDTMKQLDILFIPLVKENSIVGLETLHSALTVNKQRYENPVFIMAGGFGTRLRPLTENCPKPMLEVGGQPILETVIRSFITAGFSNFYISTHYMPEVIKAHFGDGSGLGVSISYVHEDTPLGTGGALGLLPKNLPEGLPLIMINGDVLTNINFEKLLAFHVENDADATICVREYDYTIPYGVIEGKGSKITSMIEKPTHRFFVNAGIYIVSPKVTQSVFENQCIDMPTLLDQHIQENDNVLMFPVYEYWLDIGRMDDFHKAQNDIHSLGLL